MIQSPNTVSHLKDKLDHTKHYESLSFTETNCRLIQNKPVFRKPWKFEPGSIYHYFCKMAAGVIRSLPRKPCVSDLIVELIKGCASHNYF